RDFAKEHDTPYLASRCSKLTVSKSGRHSQFFAISQRSSASPVLTISHARSPTLSAINTRTLFYRSCPGTCATRDSSSLIKRQ
ncbi:hypothetical protein PENTCL1PPCAC_16457, partial [Pristionchus entomophagus]